MLDTTMTLQGHESKKNFRVPASRIVFLVVGYKDYIMPSNTKDLKCFEPNRLSDFHWLLSHKVRHGACF